MSNQHTDGYIIVNGTIRSPGKFEGEPEFAPELWDIALSGFADSDDGRTYTFKINRDDPLHAKYPTLKRWLGRRRSIKLFEDSQGFVHCL